MPQSFDTDNNDGDSLNLSERLQIIDLLTENIDRDREIQELISGLNRQQKVLSPRYFYDEKGSQLFEQISELPEYYPTRTEAKILAQYSQEIAEVTGACELIELGSGSSTKTRSLLDAYNELSYPLIYVPIDISGEILTESAEQLLARYACLKVRGLVGTYEAALQQLDTRLLPTRTIFFLGSTIGNLTPSQCDRFLAQIRQALSPGDYFLLGIDLQKPTEILEAAYNDSQGITAEFNLNALAHLNERFQGNFDLNLFQHKAIYNSEKSQIEMYLVARENSKFALKSLDLSLNFKAGEKILTEISRKFDLQQMQTYLEQQKFQTVRTWTDTQKWFGLILNRVI